ncbi:MAG TPA: hypothetical protein EYO91_02650 [Gemmatimonadetes bacterium]|nr:hypothetical protein [Gemmatimonadota bacterium]
MHVLVADRLTCSRCGPEFGLILRADQTHDRRVTEGVLGCPNCRDQYPIIGGFGDLRAPPRPELPKGRAGDPVIKTPEESEYLLPLLGIIQGPATVLLIGGPAVLGGGLASLLDDIHVVGADADLARWPADSAWSRIVSHPGIPFFSRTLRGVVIDGRLDRHWFEEAARVIAPMSRVVVVNAATTASEWLQAAGLSIMADESGRVVATSS